MSKTIERNNKDKAESNDLEILFKVCEIEKCIEFEKKLEMPHMRDEFIVKDKFIKILSKIDKLHVA